jgi:hypothetical protein
VIAAIAADLNKERRTPGDILDRKIAKGKKRSKRKRAA